MAFDLERVINDSSQPWAFDSKARKLVPIIWQTAQQQTKMALYTSIKSLYIVHIFPPFLPEDKKMAANQSLNSLCCKKKDFKPFKIYFVKGIWWENLLCLSMHSFAVSTKAEWKIELNKFKFKSRLKFKPGVQDGGFDSLCQWKKKSNSHASRVSLNQLSIQLNTMPKNSAWWNLIR